LSGAEVASATLDAAGIVNSLDDDFTIGVLWTYSTALGGIRLNVADRDAAAAREALATPDLIEWPDEIEVGQEERCPVCGSNDFAVDSGARKTLALMLLTYVPLWFWRSRLRCRVCGDATFLPVRFRPELVLVWFAAAVSGYLITAAVGGMFGFFLLGRA
jgi:hypothetical protein